MWDAVHRASTKRCAWHVHCSSWLLHDIHGAYSGRCRECGERGRQLVRSQKGGIQTDIGKS